jgi:hypothetical protein
MGLISEAWPTLATLGAYSRIPANDACAVWGPYPTATEAAKPNDQRILGTCRGSSSLASFFPKISDAFHVLLDPLANHVEGFFLRLGGHLR